MEITDNIEIAASTFYEAYEGQENTFPNPADFPQKEVPFTKSASKAYGKSFVHLIPGLSKKNKSLQPTAMLVKKSEARVEIEASWGGDNDITYSFGASLSQADNRGNKIDLHAEIDSEGKRSVGMSFEHSDDEKQ